MNKRQLLIIAARLFLFVREVGGANKGLWVGIFQRFVGIDPGQSWCAAFVCFVAAIIFEGKGNLPFPCTGVCEEIHQYAVKHDMVTTTPQPGDLYLFVDDTGHAHHVGFYTGRDGVGNAIGIAGNTSADGLSSNGDRVAEHPLNVVPRHIVYIALPL